MRSLLRRLAGAVMGSPPSQPGQGQPASAADRPMERWDGARLAEVEAQLRGLPADGWTAEDHYLIVEWVAQRYLPADKPLTEREWQAARTRVTDKVDAALEELRRGGDLGLADWQRRETERQRLANLFREPMPLDSGQIRAIILPLLARFPFSPSLEELTDDYMRHLTLACRVPYRDDFAFEDRCAIRDSQDWLRMRLHPAVLQTARALSANYELLLRARRSGYKKVKLLVRNGCNCMAAAFDGKHAPVDGLMSAFECGNARYPVLPVPEALCASLDDPRLCDISMIALEPPVAQSPDYDEEFQVQMEPILRGARQDLVPEWASQLNIGTSTRL